MQTNKILLVDDEPDILDISNRALVKRGYEVYTAVNGRQGYDMTIKHSPDIIVSDVMMPVMNGFELCKAVKTNQETHHIPIIVLTAKTSMEDSFLYLGIKDFLAKPFSLEDLIHKVHSRLELAKNMHTQKTKIIFHSIRGMTITHARSVFDQVPQWVPIFVSSGKALLDVARDNVPDVIMIDLLMNDAPVDEVIVALKADPRLAHTDIVTYYSAISGAGDPLNVQAKMIEVQYLKRLTADAGVKEYLGPFRQENIACLLEPYRRDLIPDA